MENVSGSFPTCRLKDHLQVCHFALVTAVECLLAQLTQVALFFLVIFLREVRSAVLALVLLFGCLHVGGGGLDGEVGCGG